MSAVIPGDGEAENHEADATFRNTSAGAAPATQQWTAAELGHATASIRGAGVAHMDPGLAAPVPTSLHEGEMSSHGAALSSGVPPSELASGAGTSFKSTYDEVVHSAGGGQRAPEVPTASQPAAKRARSYSGQEAEGARAQHVQEKNRQAQARFRQRQKRPGAASVQDKMLSLEAEVKELKADKLRLTEENRNLTQRKTILEKVLALKEEQIQVLQSANTAVLSGVMHGAQAGATQAAAPVGDAAAPASGPMNSNMLIKAWKDCVKSLSSLLMQLDSEGENSGPIAQIEALMDETAELCRGVAFGNPGAAKLLVAAVLQDNAPLPTASDHWHERQLSLSQAQKEEFLNLTNSYRRNMAALADSRRAALAQLDDNSPDLGSSLQQAKKSLESGKLCTQLQELLRQEHQVHSQYIIGILDKVLNRLQLAQASVTSYPMFPDALQMAAVLEAEATSARPSSSTAASQPPAGSLQASINLHSRGAGSAADAP